MGENKRYDYLIVGAGLFGATFARLATDRGKSCLVIDKRNHTGGNLYCETVEGVTVHKYGAHIFHTSDRRVWDFVNSIVPFKPFINSPVALAPDGKLYNLPFNMNTFWQMWGVKTPAEAQAKLDSQRREIIEKMQTEGITEPRNLEEQALLLIGRDIYEQLIKGYTEKQWGMPCNQLPAFIIRRLPVRLTFDNNYFNDTYQGIPIGGYNRLIDGLLEGCDVKLGIDFFSHKEELMSMAHKIVYTGKIDEFFEYKFGQLQYRTVEFETEIIHTPNYQGNAVINYTSADTPYTRIIEHKHFETSGNAVYDNPLTVISKEFSTGLAPGLEPYYPINDERNQALYQRYAQLIEQVPNVLFGGRLAEYRYYDMAPIISQVLKIFDHQ